MNERGVIRKIDELGRLVIPREFRRALGVEAGDPLEICASENGFTIKPLDGDGELTSLGRKFLPVLREKTGGIVAVCSRRAWLYFSDGNDELCGEPLPPAATNALLSRSSLKGEYFDLNGKTLPFCLFPACSQGECYGGLALIKNEPSAADVAALELAAGLLGELAAKY